MSQAPIVIVGGGSGIGLASAKLLAEDGHAVVISGRNQERLASAASAIGRPVATEAVDASDRAALDALFKRLGEVRHLVIAASGGAGVGPFGQVTEAALRSGFEAKFWVHWHAAQAALPYMAKDGSILFITAASSRVANPGTSGLAAINGAIEKMVQTLAREMAPLRVNAISPGVIATDWWANKPAELFESSSRKAPLGRAGQPEEVAHAVKFLLSNAFITGVILDVDGGFHLT